LFIASLVIYLCFYTGEQVACRSISSFPGGERGFFARWFIPVCLVGYGGLIAVIAVVFSNLGSMRIVGEGMTPTLAPGDVVLYKKHVFEEDLKAGQLIFYRNSPESAWGKRGDIIVARILGTPGDQMAVQGEHYLVNGKKTVPVSPPGTLRLSLEIPQAPQTLVVPPGCFFMVQDDPKNSIDSQVWSWARQSEVIATRAIGLIGQAFGKEIK
jgi:signal peptidase I